MGHQPTKKASYDLHLRIWWRYSATASLECHLQRATEWGIRCLASTEHNGVFSQEEL